MKMAITSGEFALRLSGGERPGLVDYEALCNLCDGFADRWERESSEALEEQWKVRRRRTF